MKDESSRCECIECSSDAVVHVTHVDRGEVVEKHYCEVHAPDDVEQIARRELRKLEARSVQGKSVIRPMTDTLGLESNYLRAMRRRTGNRFRANES